MPQFVGIGYEKRIPAPPRSEREYRLTKSNARACLYSLIHHHLIRGEHASAIDLCEAVAIFDRNHATHFTQLGYLYKSIGQKKKSIKNFEIAIDLMKKDKKWNRKDLSVRIKSLEKEINYVAEPDDQKKQYSS